MPPFFDPEPLRTNIGGGLVLGGKVTYDYENRLVEATVGETTASFTYNGLGRRMSKTVGANTTDYLWSSVGSLPDVLYDGNYYVYGRGLVSKTDSQSDQLYYLADGMGSTTGLTDDQGDVLGTYSYDVFGAIRSETGGQANDFRFTGQQLDNETSLYYLRARYYDPAIGRFLGQDPILSLNPYTYVWNNPANFTDQAGLCACAFGRCLPCPEPIEEGADAIGDAVGEGVDDLGDALGDAGYVDLNGTVCVGLCLSVGMQASWGDWFHPYVGTGVGLQASANLTVAPGQHITTGWNCGGQYTPGEVLSTTFQVGAAGYHRDKEGRIVPAGAFGEVGGAIGIGIPVTATCVYIF